MSGPGGDIWRILAKPGCVLALAAVLFFDWVSLPNTPSARSRMAILPYRQTGIHGSVRVELYRDGSDLRAIWGWDTDPEPGLTHVENICLWKDPRRRTGWWGLTHESQQMRLINAGDLSPREIASLTSVLLDGIAASSDPAAFEDTARLLRLPGWREDRVLIGGYIHTAAAGTVALLLALSASLCARDRHLAARRARRDARGQCPECGYTRDGLAAGAHCPECGWPQVP